VYWYLLNFVAARQRAWEAVPLADERFLLFFEEHSMYGPAPHWLCTQSYA